jgi:hypothetical protein
MRFRASIADLGQAGDAQWRCHQDAAQSMAARRLMER